MSWTHVKRNPDRVHGPVIVYYTLASRSTVLGIGVRIQYYTYTYYRTYASSTTVLPVLYCQFMFIAILPAWPLAGWVVGVSKESAAVGLIAAIKKI